MVPSVGQTPPAAGAVAALGLDVAWTWPVQPLDHDSWSMLVHTSVSHRLVGLLAAAVRSGALATTAAQRDALTPIVDRWISSNLVLERFALDVHRALDERAIDHRFLKGVALAHGWYAQPDQRVFGDVDVVVPSVVIERAIDVLTLEIGPRMEPELNRGFDREFGKGATFKSARGNNEVDLHRTLVWGALGLTVVTDDLFADATPFEVGGVELLGLGPDATFLHACYSAVLGDVPPRLSALRDVAQTLPVDDAASDRVVDLACRWQATSVMATAVTRMRAHLRPNQPHALFEFVANYRPSRRERLLLRSHLMPGGTYARRLSAVAVIPGLTARARYLRATAWPSREYLASRDFTWSTHVRRSLRFADPRRRAATRH